MRQKEILARLDNKLGEMQDDIEVIRDQRIDRSDLTMVNKQAAKFHQHEAKEAMKRGNLIFIDHIVHAIVLLMVMGLVWLVHRNLNYLIGMCTGEVEAPAPAAE